MPIKYSEYPANWFTEIRPAVLERDGNKCQFCGVPNYAIIYRPEKGKPDWKIFPEGTEGDTLLLDGIKGTKIVLTIAHLDHDKENHEVKIERLAALCQRCHLKFDINHHISNRKYGRNYKENNYNLFGTES